MKTRFSLFTVFAVATTMLYLLVPACGNKSNNQPVPFQPGFGPGTVCTPGQFCQAGLPGVSGVPLVPGPVTASIDNFGSVAQLQFGGTGVVAGQQYANGAVTVTGVLTINPGGVCPPGSYTIQGQGQWLNQTGIPQVQAQLQLVGGPTGQMQGYINGNIFMGQDPYAPNVASQYYFRGNFGTTCNPGGVAL